MSKKPILLETTPSQELVFTGPFDSIRTVNLTLKNTTKDSVCFKVKTSAKKQFCVRPNSGLLKAEETIQIAVMLQPLLEIPPGTDPFKFRIQSCVVSDDYLENFEELWKNIDEKMISYNKLFVRLENEELSESSFATADQSQNMTTPQLILTQEIIDCFNECTQRLNYQDFFAKHEDFMNTLVDSLKKTKYSKDTFCQLFPVHVRTCLDNLANVGCTTGVFFEANAKMDAALPKLFSQQFENAIFTKNFDEFYKKYRSEADFIIWESRRQKVVDFQIEYKSALYENFVLRDLAVKNEKDSAEYFRKNPSFRTTNDVMKNYMKRKMKTLESEIEKKIDLKLSKFYEIERAEKLNKTIDEKISVMKIDFDKKLMATKVEMESSYQTKIKKLESNHQSVMATKLAEQEQRFENKLNEQSSLLKEMTLRTNSVKNTEEALKHIELCLQSMTKMIDEKSNEITEQEKRLKTEMTSQKALIEKLMLEIKSVREASEPHKMDELEASNKLKMMVQELESRKTAEQGQQIEAKLAEMKQSFEHKFIYSEKTQLVFTENLEKKLKDLQKEISSVREENDLQQKELLEKQEENKETFRDVISYELCAWGKRLDPLTAEIAEQKEKIQMLTIDVERLKQEFGSESEKQKNTSIKETFCRNKTASDSEEDQDDDSDSSTVDDLPSTSENQIHEAMEDEDDEFLKIQSAHLLNVAIQKERQEQELNALKKKREEKNKAAEEELKAKARQLAAIARKNKINDNFSCK